MIRRFGFNDVERCAFVIRESFREDPLYVHMMRTDDEKMGFSKFLIRKSLLLGETGLVAVHEDEIVGVASLEKDSGHLIKNLMMQLKWGLIKEAMTLKKSIGNEQFGFINQYMRFTTSVRPKVFHHYLVFVGVLPTHQGQGVGREMLDYLHGIVDADEKSAGIGLDTENEANVGYYMRFGYELVATKKIGDVDIYAMFRKRKT